MSVTDQIPETIMLSWVVIKISVFFDQTGEELREYDITFTHREDM